MRVQLCHRQSGRKVHWSRSTDCVHGLAARLPGGAHGSAMTKFGPHPPKKCFPSLIPRPSHHPVLDHLQYAKTEGEAWSILSRE